MNETLKEREARCSEMVWDAMRDYWLSRSVETAVPRDALDALLQAREDAVRAEYGEVLAEGWSLLLDPIDVYDAAIRADERAKVEAEWEARKLEEGWWCPLIGRMWGQRPQRPPKGTLAFRASLYRDKEPSDE